MKNLLIYMPMTWPQISSKTFKSFLNLVSPESIDELRSTYGVNPKVFISDKFPIDYNRNHAIDLALSNRYEADYIFFADGDQVFQPRTIQRLLDKVSDEFPIVSGIYFKKGFPYNCVMGKYASSNADLAAKQGFLAEQGFIAPDGSQCLYYDALQDFDTVQPIDVAGMGCILIRTDVFKALQQPYFKYVNPYANGGDFTVDYACEAMWFFAQIKKAGIKMLCDPLIRAGHVVEKVIGSVEAE